MQTDAEKNCPIKDKHTPMPPGSTHTEAQYKEKLGKSHYNAVCPSCGLWVMWVLKTTIDFEGAVLRG